MKQEKRLRDMIRTYRQSARKLRPLDQKALKKLFFFIVLMNGVNLIQNLETQNLYINLKNQLKLRNLKKIFI